MSMSNSMPAVSQVHSPFRQLARLRLLKRGRVGLFGGSFNPAHAGHAHVADTAMAALRLSHLFWLITPQNPFKSAASLASPEVRVQSAQTQMLKCKGRHRMHISRIEEAMAMHKGKGKHIAMHRSIDTIRLISRGCPGLRLYWVMGADNMADFHLWGDIRHLTRRVAVIIINRPGFASQALTSPMASRLIRTPPRRLSHTHARHHWCFIHGRLSPHSATRIRQREHNAA
ncbi:MAG: nicotinate-nicotinamide nucleotide adenylyltransferase [Proteobacteria bacterium]|nr:nicotinate-nicotinamide nucleotide adenylyltransferase [Pseudomonadota bacterium]